MKDLKDLRIAIGWYGPYASLELSGEIIPCPFAYFEWNMARKYLSSIAALQIHRLNAE